MNKTLAFILVFTSLTSVVFSQKGKDGAKTISTAGIKINEFTALTVNATVGNSILNVAANSLNTNARFTSTLTAGDLVMIIQMQGALIKLSPVPVWAPDSTYGRVYNNGYQSCGNYEFAQIKSVISSNQIELDCGLQHDYSVSGKTQIVRVPRFSSLNIASTGTLTTDSWNGTIGGLLVAEVDGNTTVNAGGLITTIGLGFRGGVAIGDGGLGNGNYATKNPNDGAAKGEGIGSDRLNNSTNDTLGLQCMGAPANGGGGGNANNCGGGGGANAGNINNWNGYGILNTAYSSIFDLEYLGRGSVTSSGGGKGGYGTSTGNSNPVTNGPNNTTAWGSYARHNRGGFGGHPLDYSTGKLFMGGGGGAGHMSIGQSNGTNACSGGNGGGIIYLLNYGTISGTGTITANGANGNNAFGSLTLTNPSQGLDGAGGGGGGGAIILNSIGTITSVITNANGGKGGNQIKSGTTNSEAQGPGGGGGGGYITGNGSVFTQNVNGGSYGTTSSSNFSNFPMNGATSGDVGLGNQIINNTYSLTTTPYKIVCTGMSATLTAVSTNSTATVQWFNTEISNSAISTGSVFVTPIYTTTGTYSLYVGSCPGIFRQKIVITVYSSAISVSNQTICAGQTATLSVNGFVTNYTWLTGENTNAITVTPTITTTYFVMGSTPECSSSATPTVYVNNNLNIAINSTSICAGQATTLIANGANTYTWSTTANTNSIIVNPNTTTTYTVNGTASACSGSAIATVMVYNNPTITVNSATICSGQTATLSANGALTYTWSTGANTNQILSTLTSTVSVAGSDINGCVSELEMASVNVNQTPTITINSATVCIGGNALLTANGATSYTWNTGVNTNVLNVSPAISTNYTVTGVNINCVSQATTSVLVINNPTITINSSTICSAQTTTLNATGATTYTWSNGFIGSFQLLSPTQTTTYSVLGSLANCLATSNIATVTVINVLADFTIPASPISVNSNINLINTSSNATNYVWVFCDGSNSSNTNPSVLLSNSGNCCFTLTAINSNCNHTTIKCVDVINEATVIIPNVFTPNNDGKNDLYKITFTGVKTISLTIYNRWGKMIISKNASGTSSIDWNGISEANTEVSDGTYFYVVEYTDLKDVSKTAKGYLNLFRN